MSQITKLLTPREQEVLDLLCSGSKYHEVAKKLGMSINTVRKHASNIYAKLEVKNKTQAMLKYYLS